MNEKQWLSSAEPEKMMEILSGMKGNFPEIKPFSPRKTRLNESEYRIYCDYCLDSGCCGMIRNPLLDHLRSKQPHYRGCHVIDLLLKLE